MVREWCRFGTIVRRRGVFAEMRRWRSVSRPAEPACYISIAQPNRGEIRDGSTLEDPERPQDEGENQGRDKQERGEPQDGRQGEDDREDPRRRACGQDDRQTPDGVKKHQSRHKARRALKKARDDARRKALSAAASPRSRRRSSASA
jgi:hypothetical protein